MNNSDKWKEHSNFLEAIRKTVEEINKRFGYDPKTDTFTK